MFRARPLDDMVRTVAGLGCEYIELSPRDDFMPFFLRPRADDERIAELKRLPLGVRYWKRLIEITADLECLLMNSEFNGRPERGAENAAAFWRSLDELLPLFEREGIALNLEAHPDDFCEELAAQATWPTRNSRRRGGRDRPPLPGVCGQRRRSASRRVPNRSVWLVTPSTR